MRWMRPAEVKTWLLARGVEYEYAADAQNYIYTTGNLRVVFMGETVTIW